MQAIAQLREQALAAEKRNERAQSFRLFDQAIAMQPDHSALLDSAGGNALRLGDADRAANLFRRALDIVRHDVGIATNLAIAMQHQGKTQAACDLLRSYRASAGATARYWSALGSVERDCDNLAASAEAYEHALALRPQDARALHGRARVALERGEPDRVQRFDSALSLDSGNAQLWIGKAEALHNSGQRAAAKDIARALVEQAPHWTDALKLLAQLRLADHEENYTDHFNDAAVKCPDQIAIPIVHASVLAGLDRFEAAANVIAQARTRFPNDPQLALREAIHRGEAGDDDRADHLFERFNFTSPDGLLHLARHRIRRGEIGRAQACLSELLDSNRANVGAWALQDIVWRLTGDQRHQWLHEQDGLVRLLPLHDAEHVLMPAIETLCGLHDHAALPVDQSLRGGTQTQGRIFNHHDASLQRMAAAIRSTIEEYRRQLPPPEASHPLLSMATANWRFGGSWSVRLHGGGDHHTSHIHPLGLLSSALYLVLPDPDGADENAGALELGRPPPDLRLDLAPIATIAPRAGYLALFPSTLYHGTRPFAAQHRMTVAFDVLSA